MEGLQKNRKVAAIRRRESNQSLEESVTTKTVAFARHYAREKIALV
jgi:hypothetical protein